LLLDTEKRLLNVENNRQLALLDISFDSERKEKDNQVLRTDNELKELLIKRKTTLMWLIIIVLAFTITLCISIYKRFYTKKKANRLLERLNYQVTTQNKRLEILNRELENANREKDKLFSIISHELRNPLYWFQNLAEVLSKKYKEMPPEKVQKSLSALDESAKNAFHLMDNLLQWSRSRLNRIHPKKSGYFLHTLVNDTVEMYLTILRHKGIKFYSSLPGDITIYADADLFCCIVRNLLSNAIKYTPNEGTISIECEQSEEQVTLIVSDSGDGMPDAVVNRIFSNNQENVPSMPGLLQEKGSGLGLKLCKEFAELNGGTIWVKSNPGEGTQFFFTVPEMSIPAGQPEKEKMIRTL
jgi:signal transduction histidine kinase